MKTKNFLEIDSIGKLRKLDRGINKVKSTNTNGLTQYTNLGFYIVTPLFTGLFIGYIIDNKLKSKPTGVLIGILLGLIANFYNLFRIIKSNAEN